MVGWVLLIYGGWAVMSFLKEPLKPTNQRWHYVCLLHFLRATLIDRHGGHGRFLSVSFPSVYPPLILTDQLE
jgi:hypothetical protein